MHAFMLDLSSIHSQVNCGFASRMPDGTVDPDSSPQVPAGSPGSKVQRRLEPDHQSSSHVRRRTTIRMSDKRLHLAEYRKVIQADRTSR